MTTRTLRPRTTGEVLDRAFALLRAEARPIFAVAFAFELVNHILGKAFELLGYAYFPMLMHPSFKVATQDELAAMTGQLGAMLGCVLFFSSTAILLWQLAVAALAAPLGEGVGERPVQPGAVFGRLWAQLPRLLPTLLLELVLLGVSAAVGLLPGVFAVLLAVRMANMAGLVLVLVGVPGGFLISLGAFLVVLLRFILVPQVIVGEGLTGRAALARSSALMAGKPGQRFFELPKVRGSVLLLVIGMVTNAIVLVASMPGLVMRLSDAESTAKLGSVGAVLSELLALAGESLAAPFGFLALVLFYVDLRVRREGVDLSRAADAL